jgi:membrane fusion protein, epimerase transport system
MIDLVETGMPELIIYDPTQKMSLPNDSARGAIIVGVAVLAVFFLGFGGWAAYAPLNGAVIAPAVVKVEGNRKTIQHLDGGIVKELLVREGDRVKPGQIVLILEDMQARAGADVLAQQYDALRAQEARLVAERDGDEGITFSDELLERRNDPNVAKLLATEGRQFNVRRTGLEGQIAVLRQRIEQLREQVRGSEAQQIAGNESLAIITAELKDQNLLLEKGLTQRPRVLELERTAAGLRGQQGDTTAAIARASQAVTEIELQIMQARNDRMTEVARDLRETQAKLADVVPRLQAARDVLDRTKLRSPYGGYVVDLSIFSVGAVIQRGEKVMDIVPSQNILVAEANVNVDDIHEVHPGMRAELHFTAYKQRLIPIIHGDVIEVSADRLTDKRSGTPHYTALVKVDEKELAATKEVELYPGMAVTVMIPTKQRTVLDYLLGPVVASFDQSFRQK